MKILNNLCSSFIVLLLFGWFCFSNAGIPPPSTSPPHHPGPPKEFSVETYINTCKTLNDDKDIPMECQIFTVEGDVPSVGMSFLLDNIEILKILYSPLLHALSQGYCNAQNRQQQLAYVSFFLLTEKMYQFIHCPSGQKSGWLPWMMQEEEEGLPLPPSSAPEKGI